MRWNRAKMIEERRGVSVRVCNLISGHELKVGVLGSQG